ncbi:MAG: betaine/proline/choline family ABC transporter ATP-binding protein [Trueperaceae bacterium]|nr:betaine/proline/choline family ABC transporter ATP-binding protein [Trueperaceae bacterium]
MREQFGVTVGVHNVSLKIDRGEIFVLMGLSGSGKSTLLRLLNRLHDPSRGRVLVGGEDMTALPKRALIAFRRRHFGGMVFQHFAILPDRTTLQNVAFGLELQGVPRKQRLERAREVIAQVGLEGYEDAKPGALSGGMRQRVGLARSLVLDADILLMDEPFSALDPLIRRELQDELLDLQRRVQKTIIFVTHDLAEALKLGDRIAVLKDGELQQLGTPRQIVDKPASDYVRAFVQDVDRSAVLTAQDVMQPVVHTAHPKDKARAVLETMRQQNLASLFVTDSGGTLQGQVDVSALADAAFTPVQSLARPATTVSPDTSLRAVMQVLAADTGPVAVTDDNGRLLGSIRPGAVITALVGLEPTPLPKLALRK